MMKSARILLLAAVMTSAACGASTPAGHLRYANQPPVWRVNDRQDVPKKPANREYARTLYHVDGYGVRRLSRFLEFQPHRRAADVNSLGEVPDSTWFENRIGVRPVTVEEIRRGPNEEESPEAHKPWTITGSKVGGMSVGFLMKDARGVKYLLKFDKLEYPEVETAADVIGQRLLWACGYNVPEDTIVQFVRDDLVVAPDATKKDTMGNKTPMGVADLDEGLAKVFKDENGVYRGLVSKYLPGIPIAGYPREGMRDDDPNDLIPHERRRSLRGQVAIFAWLNHTDLQEDNTLDVWEEDRTRPGRHFVVHYLIDFGKALGVMSYFKKDPTVGYSHLFEVDQSLASLVSFGFWVRDWERLAAPKIRGVGLFESEHYAPGKWKSNSPYWPYYDADRFDGFWGAKIVASFTPELIRAAVEEGRFTDPRAVEYLTKVLIERQRKTARYWFGKVNPLDRFEVARTEGGYRLCFDDLLIRHRLENVVGQTHYSAAAFDYAGKLLPWRARAVPDENGRACIDGFAPGPSHDGYVVLRLVTWRAKQSLPPTLVHLAVDPASRELRIIGLRRL